MSTRLRNRSQYNTYSIKQQQRKFILALCLILGFGVTGFCQVLTVYSIDSGVPLKGAYVYSPSPAIATVTDSSGQADLSEFRNAGIIEISLLGYQPRETNWDSLEVLAFSIGLQATNFNFEQAVISASKWRQSAEQVALRVASIPAEEMYFQNPQTAADLLGLTGSVFIQKSQQGGGSPMIRGFAANRLLYVVDGVRMNTAIFRGGNLQNVINLDPFSLEKTEVFFGPGSVLYGSDALGGVMSFQTLAPRFSSTNRVLIQGSGTLRTTTANKEKTGHLDVRIGWKKWALVSSISRWDFDHLKQGSHGPVDYLKNSYPARQGEQDVAIIQRDPLLQVPSAYSQLNLLQKVAFQPNRHFSLEYSFHHSSTSSYGRYDRHNRMRAGTLRYAEWDYGPQKWEMQTFVVRHSGDQLLFSEWNLRLARQEFSESRIDRSFNDPIRRTTQERVMAHSVNLDVLKSFRRNSSINYGIDFVLNKIESNGFTTNIVDNQTEKGPSRYPESEWNSSAVYLNASFPLHQKVTLQAGTRYNIFQLNSDFRSNRAFYPFPFEEASLNNRALTGSAGVIWHPADHWIIRGNLGTAFRAPNVDDIGKVFDSEPGAVTVPNPTLRPENATQFDLGVKRKINKQVHLEVSVFYTKLRHAMVRRSFQLGGQDSLLFEGTLSQVQALQNAATARLSGIHFGMEANFTKALFFVLDLNIQSGQEEMENGEISPSRHAPPLFGIGRIRYRHKNFQAEVNVPFQGKRSYTNLAFEERAKDEIYAKNPLGQNYAPAWYTLNLKGSWQITPVWNVSIGFENITDQRYRPYSSGISGAGRSLVVSLRVDFS